MQSHRIISGLTIFLMVVLVAIGYLVVAQPQLAAASTANDQLTSANAQVTATQATITQLKGEQTKLPALREQLTALRGSIPTGAQIPSYIDGLNSLADSTGVSITGITVGGAVAYAAPAAAAASAAAAPSSSPSATPSASASAAPVVAPVSTVWAPTTDPTITGANFVVIPVSVTTSGQTANMLAFVKGLQSGTRLFLVSGLSTAADSTSPGLVTGSIQGFIYVLLDTSVSNAAATVVTTPTTPTATTSPSGTATPTPTQSPTPTTKP